VKECREEKEAAKPEEWFTSFIYRLSGQVLLVEVEVGKGANVSLELEERVKRLEIGMGVMHFWN
jgi:hypothetical protein